MRKSCDVEQLDILENKIMENSKNYEQFIREFDNPYVLCGTFLLIQGAWRKFSTIFTRRYSAMNSTIRSSRTEAMGILKMTNFSSKLASIKCKS